MPPLHHASRESNFKTAPFVRSAACRLVPNWEPKPDCAEGHCRLCKLCARLAYANDRSALVRRSAEGQMGLRGETYSAAEPWAQEQVKRVLDDLKALSS